MWLPVFLAAIGVVLIATGVQVFANRAQDGAIEDPFDTPEMLAATAIAVGTFLMVLSTLLSYSIHE